jgi:glycosyltransferase involved in cell wall biosynthesis
VTAPLSVTFAAIIPTYNRQHIVGRAIDSALAQTYPCHEIIVMDDGSSDGTAEYVRQRYRNAPMVRLFRQCNMGAGRARNNAVRNASAEWVVFLDSDDEWYPFRLARIVEALREHSQYDVMSTGMDIDSVAGKAPPAVGTPAVLEVTLRQLLMQNGISCCLAVRRSAFLAIGGFQLDFCEDHDLTLRLLSVGHRLGFIREHMGNIHTEESGQGMEAKLWCERLLCFWQAQLKKYEIHGLMKRKALSSLYFDMSLRMMEEKRQDLSIGFLLDSLYQLPWPLVLTRYGRWQRYKRLMCMVLRSMGAVAKSFAIL